MMKQNLKIQMLAGNSLNSCPPCHFQETLTLDIDAYSVLLYMLFSDYLVINLVLRVYMFLRGRLFIPDVHVIFDI